MTFQNLEKSPFEQSRDSETRMHGARAFQLLATIQALLEYPQLHTTAEIERKHPEQVIHMPRVLERRQVVYFWLLPTIQESISVREAGQLALYALPLRGNRPAARRPCDVRAKLSRDRRISEHRQCWLQAHSSASSAVRRRAILANQTPGDLLTPDCDLRPAVRTNTRLKLYFAISDPKDIED